MAAESLEVVSVEQDGRVLSGVGVDADALRETMERHTPETPESVSVKQTEAAEINAPAPERRANKGRERYSELTKVRDEATAERDKERARAEAAERERDELRTKLAAAPARSEPAASQLAAVPVARPAATRAKPLESDVGTTYPSYADFVEDLSDWKTEQRLAALDLDGPIRVALDQDRATREHSAKVDEVLARGRKTYPDFDTVLNAPHMTATNWPGEKISVLASLDNPEHIQYQLAKDPALAEALRSEPNLAKFGMRLAQLMTAAPVAASTSTTVTAFVPPPPMQPVGSGSKTTVIPSSELASKGFDFDRSGYREKRAQERGVKARRG